MRETDANGYTAFVNTVPEHDKRIQEVRRPGSFYYLCQYVYAEDGRLVAMHDEQGRRWILSS